MTFPSSSAAQSPAVRRSHVFITPPLDGPPTGGTLYNAQLIAALQRAGLDCRHAALEPAPPVDSARVYWVDSLYLEAMPRLRAALPGCDLRLIVHYLPSLTTHGRPLRREELSTSERAALWAADRLLTTSAFMREQLIAAGRPQSAIACVEPAVALPEPVPRTPRLVPQALLLGNVVEGKGILPLLEGLERRVRPGDAFELRIAGSLTAQPSYAAACAERASAECLRARVSLLGAVPQAQALGLLQQADVLLSASRMESYGMALAEARALGVPILARAGGNSAAHVEPAAGGALLRDEHELAGAFLSFVRDPSAREQRRAAAEAARRSRSWAQAAREFIDQL